MHGPRRRHHRGTLAGALALGLLASLAATVPAAADNAAIGYPVCSGSETPVPRLPAGFTTHRTLRAPYEADRKAGNGTDFWMDRMLAREGEDPAGDWLFTRGRAVFMKEHDPSRLGFAGKAAYRESIDNRSAYTVTLSVNGENLTLRENTGARTQTPGHWRGGFTHEATGLKVTQTKFITDANVAVTNLAVTNAGSVSREVTLRAASPYAMTAEGRELTGAVAAKNNLTTVFPRLSGDGFTPERPGRPERPEGPEGEALTRTLTVPAGRTLATKVQLGFVTEEIARSRPEWRRPGSWRALALGVQEWKVYAETPASAREVHVPTPRGRIPELPGQVTLVHDDGSTTRSPVAWPALTGEQVAEGGTSLRVTGLADRAPHPVTATVWVRQTDAVEIAGVAEERVTTRAGRAPTLPATVVATYNDGSRDSRIAVTWDPVKPDQYAEPGTFEMKGTVAGTTHRATATVTMTNPS